MGALLAYSIKSGLILLAMYIVYKLLLANDNQHSFNRGVIIWIYAVSFLTLPLITFFRWIFAKSAVQNTIAIISISETTIAEATSPFWSRALIWFYLLGMVVVLFLTITTWLRIVRLLRKGRTVKQSRNYTIIITNSDEISPFSWMRYIVVSRHDYEHSGRMIIAHERKHISQMHWLDLLVAQTVIIINWFNPAAWLMRQELMLVHEYQADMAVISDGLNIKEYQLLLIKKAVGARFPSLANSLNHSQLKKRFTMMYKSKSSSAARLKALALAPAVAIGLLVVSAPHISAAVTAIADSKVIEDKGTKKSSQIKDSREIYRLTGISHRDGKIVITASATIPEQSLTVDGAMLKSGEDVSLSDGIQCSMVNSEATIIATFPEMKLNKKSMFVLTANGDVYSIEFDPSNSLTQAKEMTGVGNAPQKENIPQKETEYYIDGKKVEVDAVNALAPADIKSMYIDKRTGSVNITLNK